MALQVGKPDQAVVGLPLSADETVRTVRHLANGTVATKEIKAHVYRSADGVERYEGIFPSTDPAQQEATELVFIIDHAKHNSILLNSRLKTATIQSLPQNAGVVISLLPLQNQPTDPRVKPQDMSTIDLGKQTENMWELHGKRIKGTIPAGVAGNDAPLTVSTEVWVSTELKIVVRQIEQNPFSGERTMELTNIRREEPAPSLFQVPDGYTVKTRAAIPEIPPQLHPASSAIPEQRTKQIEDALNNPDPGIKNNVAYGLAQNGDHLADAQVLSQQALLLEEQRIADAVSGADPATAFDQMVPLSRFWDTAGYVYFRAHQLDKAEAYLRAAWELNPNSLFATHLGFAYEADSKRDAAVAMYRTALSAKPSAAGLDAIQSHLAKLGNADASPLPIDVAAPLPGFTPTSRTSTDEILIDIVISHGHPPVITLLKGDSSVKKPLTQAIESALASSLPDNGPELVIRQARVVCKSGDTPACSLHFTNTREFTTAEQARRNALRTSVP